MKGGDLESEKLKEKYNNKFEKSIIEIQKNSTDLSIDDFIKLYPKYLTFTGKNDFFVTPLVLNKYDLMLLYIEQTQFNNIVDKLRGINNFINKNLTNDELFNEYNSFIISSENNPNAVFILNLALLLQSNCHESFFQKIMVYYNEDHTLNQNKNQNQSGGVTLRERLLATGGMELIENSFNISSILVTLTALNSLLGMNIPDSVIIVLSIIILSIGTKNTLSIAGRVLNRGIGMLPPNIRNNRAIRLFSSANIDTIYNYLNNINCRISTNVSDALRQQYATYTANLYNNDMKINSIPYEQLKQQFIEFQQSNGYLTNDFTDEQIINEPVQPPNIENNELRNFVQINQNDEGRTVANLTPDGIAFFNNLSQPDRNSFKQRLQNLFQNQQEKAAIMRLNLNAILNPAPQQQVNVRREFKQINCPVCDSTFSFNPTDGYIHQVQPNEEDINQHINMLRQPPNENIAIDDALEKKQKESYNLIIN